MNPRLVISCQLGAKMRSTQSQVGANICAMELLFAWFRGKFLHMGWKIKALETLCVFVRFSALLRSLEGWLVHHGRCFWGMLVSRNGFSRILGACGYILVPGLRMDLLHLGWDPAGWLGVWGPGAAQDRRYHSEGDACNAFWRGGRVRVFLKDSFLDAFRLEVFKAWRLQGFKDWKIHS